MNTRQRKTLRIGVLSALVAATGMTLGACAPYYSQTDVELYNRITSANPQSGQQAQKAPAQTLTMDPMDRGGGGAGGGGGGGGGH
jgi:hypothetical protein